MFTGIVEEQGRCARASGRATSLRAASIEARATLEGSELGASVAVNGVCLTVVEAGPTASSSTSGPETLARTALGQPRGRGSGESRATAPVRRRGWAGIWSWATWTGWRPWRP